MKIRIHNVRIMVIKIGVECDGYYSICMLR